MKIRGIAPLRISFAGGGTDLNYIFEKYGGAVVSSTIDKFCHMTIEERKDRLVYINGKLLDDIEILADKVCDYFKPTKGFNLTYYNDIPPGSGLGSSSSFVVLLLRLLYELHGGRTNDYDLVKQSYEIETSIKEGGWQDQYATTLGGFNFMDFGKGYQIVYPLRLNPSFIRELNEHFVLVYIGGSKEKRDLHKELRKYSEKNIDEMKRTANIKGLAYRMRDALLKSEIKDIPSLLRANWKLKRNKFTSSKRIDNLYKLALKNGVEGGKLCGSGQAGYFIFFCKPENRKRLIDIFKDKYKIVDFNFSNQGCETWQV